MYKYFKPESLTWWASFVPLVAGVVLAMSAATGWLPGWVVFINALTGGVEPAVMVSVGLFGIGLRGAV